MKPATEQYEEQAQYTRDNCQIDSSASYENSNELLRDVNEQIYWDREKRNNVSYFLSRYTNVKLSQVKLTLINNCLPIYVLFLSLGFFCWYSGLLIRMEMKQMSIHSSVYLSVSVWYKIFSYKIILQISVISFAKFT